jgi:FixJ family two-component response regulator
MAPTLKPPKIDTARPRVLVVDDEPAMIDLVTDVVGRATNCRLLCARDLREARQIIEEQEIDLMLADVKLPDGSGMTLLPALQQIQPNAAAVVITGSPSIDGAIDAIRAGVVDFLPKPFTAEHLIDRVNKALKDQAIAVRNNKRLSRLKVAVKRLNTIRRTISKKVDLLCNDLVSAYGELSKQVDQVRVQEGFRKTLAAAHDLEQLLCHAMDWMLRHVGYCNVAVWLASEEHDFELGAYMKYTIPGDKQLTDAMKGGILPLTQRESLVLLEGETIREQLTAAEFEYLHNQSVLAVNCTYLGESLAAIVLFRDARAPFTDNDVAAIQSIAPIFAVALADVVRHADHQWDDSPFYDDTQSDQQNRPLDDRPLDDRPLDDRDDNQKPKNKNNKNNKNNKKDRDRTSDADWWKRGEAPPF